MNSILGLVNGQLTGLREFITTCITLLYLFQSHFHVVSSQCLPEAWRSEQRAVFHLDLKPRWPGKQKNIYISFTELKIGCGLAVMLFHGLGVAAGSRWLLQLCLSHEICGDWGSSACRPSAGKRGRARRHQHQLALIRRPGLAGVAATFMSGILMPAECWDTAAVTTELTSAEGGHRPL